MSTTSTTSNEPQFARLHSRTNSDLIPLLESHLPLALPVYNSLHSPELPSFVSFARSESVPELFVIIVDLGIQIRFYCSYEKVVQDGRQMAEHMAKAEELVTGVLAEFYGPDHRPPLDVEMIGALSSIWLPALSRSSAFQIASAFQYLTYLGPNPSTLDPSITLPSSLIASTARGSDITEILSTSEVKHSPSLLASRLSHSSAFYSTPDDVLVAHCFTHRDGSLGTLHVSSSHRRQGLAALVVQHRIAQEKLRSFSYVGGTNEASRGLMKSLGWEEGWAVAWVRLSSGSVEPRVKGLRRDAWHYHRNMLD